MIGTSKDTGDSPRTDETPDLPGLRTWPAVYLVVLGCYVLYVIALAALSRWFA
jgi:hypothetical protein